MKKQFNPDFRDMPLAFKTVTKKGKSVFRIRLNEDELLSRFEEGKVIIAIDIPVSPKGYIPIRSGKSAKGKWEGFPFYCWAVEKKKKEVV